MPAPVPRGGTGGSSDEQPPSHGNVLAEALAMGREVVSEVRGLVARRNGVDR